MSDGYSTCLATKFMHKEGFVSEEAREARFATGEVQGPSFLKQGSLSHHRAVRTDRRPAQMLNNNSLLDRCDFTRSQHRLPTGTL